MHNSIDVGQKKDCLLKKGERHPQYEQGPMVSRDPRLSQKTEQPLGETEVESLWKRSIQGTSPEHEEEAP